MNDVVEPNHLSESKPVAETPLAHFEALPPVRFSITNSEIAKFREECKDLSCDTREGYEATRIAIGKGVKAKTTVEREGKTQRESAIAHQRAVLAEEHRVVALLLGIIDPLKAKKKVVDDEKERIAREKVEAAKRAEEERIAKEVADREAKLKAERDADEARIKAERAALEAERKAAEAERAEERRKEEARLAEERKKLEQERAKQRAEHERMLKERQAEEARLAAERKAELERLHKEQQARDEARRKEEERLAAERKAIEDERRAVAKAKEAAERAEFERQAKIKAAEDAAAKAERDRIAAEEARVKEAERKVAEEKRLAAIRPDVEKVHAFGHAITRFVSENAPECKSEEAKIIIDEAVTDLQRVYVYLSNFTAK